MSIQVICTFYVTEILLKEITALQNKILWWGKIEWPVLWYVRPFVSQLLFRHNTGELRFVYTFVEKRISGDYIVQPCECERIYIWRRNQRVYKVCERAEVMVKGGVGGL